MSGSRIRLRCEQGMTAIEMLVAVGIFAVLSTLAFTAVINASSNLKAIRQTNDLNEESRLVLNRISREMREASAIVGATNPDAWNWNTDGSERLCATFSPPCFNPNADVSVTFDVDFNANGTIEPAAADPERLTYTYERANRRLLLQTSTQTTPILAGNVSAFKVVYRSSEYRCDANYDGLVMWQELEGAQSPPCPGNAGSMVGGSSALDTELAFVDQVIIEITVLTPPREQQYRTKIDLRNRA